MTCMRGRATEYRCWRSIDYRPALSDLSAEHLAPYLQSRQRALEIGCNRGSPSPVTACCTFMILLMTPQCESYRERYIEGERRGWRTGNFAVPGREGGMLFIAHHHSKKEIAEISYPYQEIFLNFHDSVSLNGNACRMFEFLGKRRDGT
jgi:hypothetical protein